METYSSNAQNDPTGASTGTNRIFRGGSSWDVPQWCRSAQRGNGTPSHTGGGVGFRLVRLYDEQVTPEPTLVQTPTVKYHLSYSATC